MLLNPVITGSQREAAEALAVMRGMRADSRWTFLVDDTTLTRPTVDTAVLMGHRQVTDLHLVNLAAESGAVLATFDAEITAWLSPRDRQHVLLIPA